MHNTDKVRNADSHTAGRAPLTVLGSNELVRTTASSKAMNTKYPAYIHSLLFSVLLATFTRTFQTISQEPLHDVRVSCAKLETNCSVQAHRFTWDTK
jgi:hypothetical protein